MDIVFLGINDVGNRIYEWLCNRESVTVQCLITTQKQLNQLKTLRPDIVVSVGYQHHVPSEILSLPPEGCINLHPAYLPYNRGANPNVWSIVEGTPAGVTLHYMDENFDEGEVIARREVDVSFEDTGKSLHRRLERAQYELFTETWPAIEDGSVETSTQESEKATYHTVSDFQELCEIDPDERYTAKELLDILRALTFPPFDNAHLEIDGEKYYVDVDVRKADDSDSNARVGLLESY